MAKDLEKVRVAMIGAGGMARNVHYPSLASFDDVEMVPEKILAKAFLGRN